ncbi:MAG TPA: T9SS type A sorting domain-containing protein, partial [Chryseosolibacter sp.]
VAGDVFEGDVNLYSDQGDSPTLGSFFRLADAATSQFKGNINISTKVGEVSEIKVEFARGGGTAEFNGTTAQSITYGGTLSALAIKFGNLHMKNSSGLNLNFPATVFGNANMQFGVIQLNTADSITFYTNATVTNANDLSYIDGKVIKRGKAPFVFPIGTGGAYHPIGMSAPTDEGASFLARYFPVNHNLGSVADIEIVKVSDCEYWTLDRLAGTDNPAVTLFWNSPFCRTDYIKSGFEGDVRVVRWSGAQWNNLGASNLQVGPAADGTDGNLTAAGPLPDAASHLLTFGTIVPDNAMPIDLLFFQATPAGMHVQLQWETATETNNDYFTIERLHDNSFVAIGKVEGAGTSMSAMSYHWTDTRPLSGRSYYRLKQTDFDGRESYSEVISFLQTADSAPYPNPGVNTLFLDGISFGEDSKIVLRDITGRTLYSSHTAESIDLSAFVPGIYHLGITTNGTVQWYPIRKE